jgi:hypothetical protein
MGRGRVRREDKAARPPRRALGNANSALPCLFLPTVKVEGVRGGTTIRVERRSNPWLNLAQNLQAMPFSV